MRGTVLSAIVLSSLLTGTAALAGYSEGVLGSYDRMNRTFWINGQEYLLPETNRRTPHNGERVSVSWDQSDNIRLVNSFTVEQRTSDGN
jgi:hypothetical protein